MSCGGGVGKRGGRWRGGVLGPSCSGDGIGTRYCVNVNIGWACHLMKEIIHDVKKWITRIKDTPRVKDSLPNKEHISKPLSSSGDVHWTATITSSLSSRLVSSLSLWLCEIIKAEYCPQDLLVRSSTIFLVFLQKTLCNGCKCHANQNFTTSAGLVSVDHCPKDWAGKVKWGVLHTLNNRAHANCPHAHVIGYTKTSAPLPRPKKEQKARDKAMDSLI